MGKDIITPRPIADPPTFGITIKIGHPPGARGGALKQARIQALAMLESMMDFDYPVTFWFSTPMIDIATGKDGEEVAVVELKCVGKSAERLFNQRAQQQKQKQKQTMDEQ